MSKIDRYNGEVKAFASEALTNERTIFGEVTESDSLTDQINTAFLRGWAGTVGANDFPSVQDFSAAFFTSTQFISYLHQMGIAEWNSAQEYPTTGAACVYDGFLWLRTDDWALTDEPTFISDSWYLNHPIFQWAVSQLAGGDKSKVAFIKEGVSIGSYEWMIWPATGQVFDVNGASGTFGADFDPSTGTATGISDGPLLLVEVLTKREVELYRKSVSITMTDAAYTLDSTEQLYGRIEISGTLTAEQEMVVGTEERFLVVKNSTDYAIKVACTPGGNGVHVPSGGVYDLRCDGANILTSGDKNEIQVLPYGLYGVDTYDYPYSLVQSDFSRLEFYGTDLTAESESGPVIITKSRIAAYTTSWSAVVWSTFDAIRYVTFAYSSETAFQISDLASVGRGTGAVGFLNDGVTY